MEGPRPRPRESVEAARSGPALQGAPLERRQSRRHSGLFLHGVLPLGGPDALYPTAFFPDASAFTLVGLEPVGAVPDLAALTERLDEGLKEMELYVTPILQISFFRTNDMEVELARRGPLPS